MAMNELIVRTAGASRQTWLGVGLIAAVAVLVPLPILLANGWPHNDDQLSMFQRAEAFRRSYETGVWYPVWTPWCHAHYGSPYPLFYHRLYSTIAAALALSGISLLRVVKSLTVLLLFVGGTGMRRLLRVSGTRELLASLGAALFIIAPYTRTNWLTRGAMAEFTAMMLLPWLYAELCLWWQGQRHPMRLACGVALLFHAHAIIAFYFLWSTAVFLAATLTRRRRSRVWAGWRGEAPWFAAAGLVLVVFVLVPLVVTWSLQWYFNVSQVMGDPRSPLSVDANFLPPLRYLVDSWRGTAANPFHKNSFEVNRFLLAGLLLLLFAPGVRARWSRERAVPLLGFLMGWSVVCGLLQLRSFLWAFHVIPLARFSQFPFRLLAFVTVGSIFLFISTARVSLAGGSRERRWAAVVSVVVVVLSAWTFGVIVPNPVDSYSEAEVDVTLSELDGPISAGEYMPAGYPKWYFESRRRKFLDAPGCLERLHVREGLGHGAFRLTADLDAPCRISLRQVQTPILSLELQNAAVLSHSPAETYEIELQPGHSAVTLRPHTFWELVKNTFGWQRGA